MTELTEIRNEKRAAARQQMGTELVEAAQRAAESNEVVAWAVVAFRADGQSFRSFDTGGIMPLWAFPEAVKGAVDEVAVGVDEDFDAQRASEIWARGRK